MNKLLLLFFAIVCCLLRLNAQASTEAEVTGTRLI